MSNCTCPHSVQPLGVLHGVNMGRGTVRLSTAPGCSQHDACHAWTAQRRAERRAQHWWSVPYCSIHATRDCHSPSLAFRKHADNEGDTE